MSEVLATKTRDVLGECTEDWQKDTPEPLEAVRDFHNRLGELAAQYSTYLSTAISSAGWVRDTTLPIGTAIKSNADTSLRYADYLHRAGDIDAHYSIDAVSLGHIPGWGQLEYLTFWLPVMSRPDLTPENLRVLEKAMKRFTSENDVDLMNDSSASHTARRPVHQAFEKAFLTASADMDKSPITQVVQEIDPDESLGGDVEKLYAADEMISLMRLSTDRSVADFIAKLDDPELASQLTALDRLGARFIEHTTEEGICLRSLDRCLAH